MLNSAKPRSCETETFVRYIQYIQYIQRQYCTVQYSTVQYFPADTQDRQENKGLILVLNSAKPRSCETEAFVRYIQYIQYIQRQYSTVQYSFTRRPQEFLGWEVRGTHSVVAAPWVPVLGVWNSAPNPCAQLSEAKKL